MRTKEELKQAVCEAIDRRGERIIGLGESIMDQPELGFKERRTAQKVGEVFAELGLEHKDGLALTGVTVSYTHLTLPTKA